MLKSILFFPACLAASQQSGLFSSGLADADGLFLARRDRPFATSAFSGVEGFDRFRLQFSTLLLPTLKKEGGMEAEVYSSQSEGRLLYSLKPGLLAMGAGFDSWIWRHHLSDPGEWSLRWQESRGRFPVSLYLLPHSLGPLPGMSMMLEVADGGASLQAAMKIRGAFPWATEIRFATETNTEEVSLSGAGDSVPEEWEGRYLSRRWEAGWHGLVATSWGSLEAKVGYRRSQPHVDSSEYQLSDSSQVLILGALGWIPRYASALRWEFMESQSFTFGRRYPPGTASVRRFHYALGHGYFNRIGLETGFGDPGGPPGRWGFAVTHRFYRYRNSSHPNALNERKETLSYNRLESSYLNTIWGGFFQSSELASVFLDLHRSEFKTDWKFRTGPLIWEAELPVSWVDLYARLHEVLLTEQLFYTTVDRVTHLEKLGPMLWMTPSLTVRFASRRAAVFTRVSHAILAWEKLRDGDGNGSRGNGVISQQRSEYPILGNGTAWEGAVTLDF